MIPDALRLHLIAIARGVEVTTYRRLAGVFGLDLSATADREALANALREVSVGEHREGRPLLSAVVVLAGRGRPGAGFFACARELGVLADVTDEEFYARELARVYGQWSEIGPFHSAAR